MDDKSLDRSAALARRAEMIEAQERKRRDDLAERQFEENLAAQAAQPFLTIVHGEFLMNGARLRQAIGGKQVLRKLELPCTRINADGRFPGYECFTATSIIAAFNSGAYGLDVMGCLGFVDVLSEDDLEGAAGIALGYESPARLKSGYRLGHPETGIEDIFRAARDKERTARSSELRAWVREGGKGGEGQVVGELAEAVPFRCLCYYASPDAGKAPQILGVVSLKGIQAATPAGVAGLKGAHAATPAAERDEVEDD